MSGPKVIRNWRKGFQQLADLLQGCEAGHRVSGTDLAAYLGRRDELLARAKAKAAALLFRELLTSGAIQFEEHQLADCADVLIQARIATVTDYKKLEEVMQAWAE